MKKKHARGYDENVFTVCNTERRNFAFSSAEFVWIMKNGLTANCSHE